MLAVGFFPFIIEDPKSLIASIIGFLILLFVVVKVFPPSVPLGVRALTEALKARHSKISTAHDELQAAIAEVERVRNDYKTRLGQVEQEAHRLMASATTEADETKAVILAEAETSANQLRIRAREELERERFKNQVLLRRQVVQLTVDAAESSLRSHQSAEMQSALIGNFVADAANREKRSAA